MNLWPQSLIVPLPTITPLSLESVAGAINTSMANAASAAWPAANRAIFIPFSLQMPILVTKLFSCNGSAGIPNDNIDVGVYAVDGTRIASIGSTAQSGTDTAQNFDIADTQLGIGEFYLAVAMNGTTGQLYRTNAAAALLRKAGCFQMASAFPLPATATFALVASAYLPMVGLLQGRTVL